VDAPGPWCAYEPLWGSPTMRLELPFASRPAAYRSLFNGEPADPEAGAGVAHFAAVPAMRTVGDLVAVMHRMNRSLLARRHLDWSNTPADQTAFRQALLGGAHAGLPDSLSAFLYDVPRLWGRLQALWRAVPAPWRMAAKAAQVADGRLLVGVALEGAAAAAAARRALAGAGWRLPDPVPILAVVAAVVGHVVAAPAPAEGPVVPPAAPPPQLRLLAAAMPVRVVTAALTLPHCNAVRRCWAGTALSALRLEAMACPVRVVLAHSAPALAVRVQLVPAPSGAALAARVAAEVELLARRVRQVWCLPWENAQKEAWWRLLLHGVPGAGGHGAVQRHACACGWAPSPGLAGEAAADARREHVFWLCPVAVAVRDLLQGHLPPGVSLLPYHLWLLASPSPTVHPGVWSVVALAGLSAMFRSARFMASLSVSAAVQSQARARLRAALRARGRPLLRQVTLHEALGVPDPRPPPPAVAGVPVAPVVRAARDAVVRTLAGVRDFVEVGLVPATWRAAPDLGPGHPFLGMRRTRQADGGDEVCQLQLNFVGNAHVV
jgi:hypothetical protein